jgi:oligoendopeptidase F
VKILQGTIEEMKQDKRETDGKHAQDLLDLTAKYEAKGEKDRAEIRAEFEQNKSEMVERMNKIMDLLASQQQTSTSDTQAQESSNASCRLFKP